jgi:hypothetical protein
MTEHIGPPIEVAGPDATNARADTVSDCAAADTTRADHPATCTALVGKGRTLAGCGRYAAAPVPPVGRMPDAATVFVGTLLWSSPADAADVLHLVADDDLDPPLSVLVASIRTLVDAGKPCDAQVVFDELRRRGELSGPVAKALQDATTAGAVPQAAVFYAAAVVEQALRRKVESAGHALTSAATTAPEAELSPLVANAAATVAGIMHRLSVLRGEAS